MSPSGITKQGEKAEGLLCENTNNITRNPDKSSAGLSKGDNYYNDCCTNTKFAIEVKTNAWNQTRPYKYIPVVGYLTEDRSWFVVPPDVVAVWASNRKGQHCMNPFECVCMGKPSATSKRWLPYLVQEHELEQKVLDAFLHGEKNQLVKEFCLNMANELEISANKAKNSFKSLQQGVRNEKV